MILEKIQNPNDVKALSAQEAEELCGELRQFLIDRKSTRLNSSHS